MDEPLISQLLQRVERLEKELEKSKKREECLKNALLDLRSQVPQEFAFVFYDPLEDDCWDED